MYFTKKSIKLSSIKVKNEQAKSKDQLFKSEEFSEFSYFTAEQKQKETKSPNFPERHSPLTGIEYQVFKVGAKPGE